MRNPGNLPIVNLATPPKPHKSLNKKKHEGTNTMKVIKRSLLATLIIGLTVFIAAAIGQDAAYSAALDAIN